MPLFASGTGGWTMAAADVALTLFALCNSLRVLAYLPQIVAVLRDNGGAHGVSCTTWALFAVSNFSTVLYAIMTLQDATMAAIFGANTTCCLVILGLTANKRGRLKRLTLISMTQGVPNPSKRASHPRSA